MGERRCKNEFTLSSSSAYHGAHVVVARKHFVGRFEIRAAAGLDGATVAAEVANVQTRRAVLAGFHELTSTVRSVRLFGAPRVARATLVRWTGTCIAHRESFGLLLRLIADHRSRGRSREQSGCKERPKHEGD